MVQLYFLNMPEIGKILLQNCVIFKNRSKFIAFLTRNVTIINSALKPMFHLKDSFPNWLRTACCVACPQNSANEVLSPSTEEISLIHHTVYKVQPHLHLQMTHNKDPSFKCVIMFPLMHLQNDLICVKWNTHLHSINQCYHW